ncbi:MAG: nucleotidyltransferase domain-containing protein [Patescibacteria group bacterium]
MDILNLTKSKARTKILQLFFADTQKRYYLRELERLLGLSVGNIRRELIALEKTSLFLREKQGNQVYYSLNKQAPIFEEFKKIISKTIGLEANLKKELKKVEGIKQAFIFGSFAKGEEQSASDIDLMIIGKVNEDLLIKKISQLEFLLKREINYHLFSETEWQKKFKTNSFLKAVVNGPKIKII